MTTSNRKSDFNWDTFSSYCSQIALGILHNSIQAEDVAQEALTQALPKIQGGEVNHPKAYLRQVTRHLCFKLLKEPVGISDDFVPAPGIETETASSAFEVLRRREPQKAQGVLRSIELTDELFNLKVRIRQRKSEAGYLFDTRQVIDAACRRLRLPVERTDELRRYLMLQDKEPFERTPEEEAEFDKLKEGYFKLELLQGFCTLRSLVEGSIYTDPVFNPYIRTYGNFEDLVAVSRLKIAPVKLLIKVWHRALKRGRKYGDLKLIQMLALEFKERTRNTPQAHLFSGLTDKNFNTLRKRSLYSSNKGFNKLARRVYKLGFLTRDENLCKKD